MYCAAFFSATTLTTCVRALGLVEPILKHMLGSDQDSGSVRTALQRHRDLFPRARTVLVPDAGW